MLEGSRTSPVTIEQVFDELIALVDVVELHAAGQLTAHGPQFSPDSRNDRIFCAGSDLGRKSLAAQA